MRRREFLGVLGGTAIAWSPAARAQQPAMPVVGFLGAPSPPYTKNVAAIHHGLKQEGYVESQNMASEYRWAEGQYDRLPALAAELVSRRVAVVVTLGGAAPALAAKAATSTIPIVFHLGGDPVRFGLVGSLNRPGGNVTGVSFLTVALAAKRLALLHELVPTASIVGLLINPNNPNAETVAKEVREAVRNLGLRLHIVNASSERDIDAAFARFVEQHVGAIFVDADAIFLVRRGQIGALAIRHALPSIYGGRDYVEAGGLMSYGSSITDAYRQAGTYAGRILKGETPANLPVMQSTKFEFVMNLNTAKALGLQIPDKLLALADEVIE
jgi:putative ABC transport system substrate-binding protein